MRRIIAATLGIAMLGGLALGTARVGASEKDEAYMVNVEDASAKVGERTAIVATVATRAGYKFAGSYRNRIIELSALDDTVAFEQRVVRGSLRDGNLVFNVGVTPTKVGRHIINGVFRIGFHNGERLNMVSVPLIATVVGTE